MFMVPVLESVLVIAVTGVVNMILTPPPTPFLQAIGPALWFCAGGACAYILSSDPGRSARNRRRR